MLKEFFISYPKKAVQQRLDGIFDFINIVMSNNLLDIDLDRPSRLLQKPISDLDFNLREEKENLIIDFKIPDIYYDNLNIALDEPSNSIIIKGMYIDDYHAMEAKWSYTGLETRTFHRQIILPVPISQDGLRTIKNNGFFKIVIKKKL